MLIDGNSFVLDQNKAAALGCHWLCQCLFLFVPLLVAPLTGCPNPKQPPATTNKVEGRENQRASVALRLVVVNDEALADSIGRLRGEWAERSGGTLTTDVLAWPDLIDAGAPAADVVIFPSRYLGELCEKKWLRPVRENVLQSSAFNAADIFPLVRQQLIIYDKQVYAAPLGIDLPVMCYRGETFDESRRVPQTWSEYLKFIQTRKVSGTGGPPAAPPRWVWEPLQSWGSVMLLARVAGYASQQRKADLLFDEKTMKPRLSDAAFVRALNEIRDAGVAVGREAASEVERKLQDPRAASWYLATGNATFLAMGLPPAGHRGLSPILSKPYLPSTGNEVIRWTHIPGANEIDHPTQGWQRVDSVHYAPILAVGDRLASVTTSSRNAATAFQLLGWLAEADVSTQFARASSGTMPVRPSLAASSKWYDETVTAQERSDLATVLSESLSGEECLLVPRIPGVDEYLAALAEAVEDVVVETAEPHAALEKAARTWELLTEKRGREAQRQAYLRHLGIDSK
jgi:ABC-type glycerol-3-phosphate transport system substrate-binding protein